MVFVYSLTKEQERLWVEWKINPKGHAYNTNFQFNLSGYVDIERLQHAIDAAIKSFASFRTYFIEKDGIPHQIIMDEASIKLDFHDLVNDECNEEQCADVESDHIILQALKSPFDLTQFPLTRFCLVRYAPDLYKFIYVKPHILVDGQSARLLLKTLSDVYNGQTAPYNQRCDVSDYLHYIETVCNQDYNSSANAYWNNKLQASNLYFDFATKNIASTHDRSGNRIYFSISPETHQRLKSHARGEKATLFVALSAIWASLLFRYFRQESFVITYPVNIRPAELKNIYGFYINNLPLTFNFNDSVTYQNLLLDITEQRRYDRNHDFFSLRDIVKSLRESGKNVGQSDFNISIAEANFSLSGLDLAGVLATARPCAYEEVTNDIALQYDSSGKSLECAIEYRTAVFDEYQIQSLIRSFNFLIESCLQSPEVEISALPILDQRQMEETVAISSSPESHIATVYIPYLFEQQCKKTPSAIALVYERQEVTYAELDAMANDIAARLASHGVTLNDTIGVFLDRSIELIASIIGIWKIGGIYVPVDIQHPKERIKWMVDDSRVTQIITTRGLASLIPDGYRILCLEQSTDNLQDYQVPCCSHNSAAYIIYTSGSTGRPKGVVVSHGNLASRIKWFHKTFPIGYGEFGIHNFNHCFDASLFEILPPLCSGGTLVMLGSNEGKQPRKLIEAIDKYRIKSICLTPSYWQALMSVVKDGECSSLCYIQAGGEVLAPSLAKQIANTFNGVVYNLYGPTEATLLATWYCYDPAKQYSSIPIGRGLDNTPIYILNHCHQLQPVGMIGEIYIGGEGIALGYLNNPELTQDRFIPDIYSETEGKKLYKTRDLGRYLPDGNIEFIGRIDEQVKLRGYRIELGEIENAIHDTKLVRSVAVVLRTDDDRTPRIVAYYVSDQENIQDQIKQSISATLPQYMIPAAFIPVQSLPQTQNGKIDRKHLSSLRIISDDNNRNVVLPRNATEEKLRTIWANVIKTDAAAISVMRPFFESGGDSLMAIELCLQIEREFQIKVADYLAFQLPTIEAWAQHIAGAMTKANDGKVVDRASLRRAAMHRKHEQEKRYG